MRNTHDELLASNGTREVPIESNTEIIRVITLICNDVFQEGRLVAENFCESCTTHPY